MKPEDKINQLEQQIRELKRIVDSMQRPNTVSPEFYQVLTRGVVTASSKSPTAENQTVNEGGVASYSVLKAPDGFKSIGGFNFPYYL